MTHAYWDTDVSGIADDTDNTAPEGKTTSELQTPTETQKSLPSYPTGIYSNWNVNVDGVTGNDNPWDFGTSSQYPVLHVRTLPHALLQGVPTVTWAVSNTTICESAAGTNTNACGASPVTSTTITPTLSAAWATDLSYTIPVNAAYTSNKTKLTIPAGDTTVTGATLTAVNNKVDAADNVLNLSPLSSHLRQASSVPAITIKDEDIPKPTGVKLSVDGTKVQVDWTEVSLAGGYEVEWDDDSDFSSPLTGTKTITSGSTTTHKITSGLTSGTTYYFRVIATATGYEDSAPSDVVSVTPTTGDVDYDADNDGLIDVDTLAKLNAIRWDLDGDGVGDKYDSNGDGDYTDTGEYDYTSNYAGVFSSPEDNMGCGESAVSITSNTTGNPTCTGYELAANLDFDTDGDGDVDSGDTYWNSGAGWTPIGDATTGYTGEFEGNGASYKISNLFINSTTSSGSAYAGLFGVIGSGGEVRNVKLEDVDVTAAVTSTTSTHEVYAGAVAGKNSGTVSGSSSLGEVAITRSGGTSAGKGYAGGLVGWNDGTIVSSYSRVEVTATSDDANEAHAGGLIALNDTGDTIAASFATGSVTATTADTGTLTNTAHAGGLVSHNKGTITASYAHGDGTVKGNKVVRGGFAATNASGATITASFSTGSHTGTGTGTGATTASGGLVATHTGSTVTNSYWDTTTSGITATGAGTGKTTSELQTPTTRTGIYAGWNVDADPTETGTQDGWDFGTASQYPAIKHGLTAADQRAAVTVAFSPISICESSAGTNANACGASPVTSSTMTATISPAQEVPVTLTFSTNAAVYTLKSGNTAKSTITIAAGSTSGTLTLEAVNNKTDASDKSVTLTPTTGRNWVNVTGASLTITDEDIVAKPTGVKVSVDGTKAQVDWTAVTDATGYTVQWSTSSTFATKSDATISSGSTTTHKITSGLTSGMTYYFRVIATATGYDDSTPSDSVSATPTTGNVDYDNDNNGLIGVDTLAKLNAIRWDLDGDGQADDPNNQSDYDAAFPNAEDNMGCGETAATISSNDTGNPACKGYELTKNLDFDTGTAGDRTDDKYWNSGAGWEPIGGVSGRAYTGEFDGQTFTISNLFIDRTSGNYAGLFAYLNGGSGTTVKNVSLVNVDVTLNVTSGSSVHVGGLAGRVGNGGVTLEDSYTTGRVRAGESATEPVTLTASPGYSYVGGLVGRTRAAITGSYSLADVTSNTKSASASPNALVGGLVGEVRTSGSVTASYAAGDVTANIVGLNSNFVYAGGLVGHLEGDITASYARGAVTATSDATVATGITGNAAAGGLVGSTPSGSSITASFSTGAPTATGDGQVVRARGLVGLVFATASVTNSYWDTDTSGITTTGAGTGKTTSELQTPTAYGTGSSIYANWNLNLDGVTGNDDPWAFGTASQYPVLKYGGQTASQQRVTVTLTASPTTIWERALTTPSRVNQSTLTVTPDSAWDKNIVVTLPASAAVYSLGGSTLTINVGSTTAQTTTMTAVNNLVDAANNAVSLAITADSPWVTIGTAPTVTINDDDELAKATGVKLSVDGTKVRVDWTAVTGATGYKVQWNSTSSTSWTSPSEGTVSSGSTTNYTINPTPALSADTRYYVRVLPTKSGADEPPSDVVDVKTHATSPATVDYDADNDGLIEITTLAQLNAVRWDLDGDGVADDSSDQSSYDTAFPNAEDNMGCNESAATITAGPGNPACTGYELAANLDFDTNNDGRTDITGDTYWDGGKGWQPIAHDSTSPDSSSDPFNAVFEGNNYVISNLFINRRGTRTGSGTNTDPHIYTLFAGLFGDVGSGAKIRNLGVEDVSVTFKNYLTSIPSAPEVYAGGLAGYSAGEIFKTYVTGTVNATVEPVSGTDKHPHAGGLIGRQVGGSITSSYARVTTTANFAANDANSKSYAGGLVAYQDGGDIVSTYARGSATAIVSSQNNGEGHAGGLIGYHKDGEIKSSYSEADATATAYATGVQYNLFTKLNVGGLVGTQDGGKITASYSVGTPTATTTGTGTIYQPTNNVGGLTGNHVSGTTTDSYWDTDVSGITTTGQGTGKTTSQLQTPTDYGTGANDIYKDWEFDLDDADGDDNDTTGKDDQWHFGTASDYPVLQYHLTIPPQRATITMSANRTTICESAKGTDANACGASPQTSATITATLANAWHAEVTVTLPTNAAYTLSSGTISLPAGTTSATTTLTAVNNKTQVATDPSFTLAAGTGDPWVSIPGAALSITITDEDTLAKPTGVKLSVDGVKVQVDWTAVTGATGYKVQRSTSSTFATVTETAVTSGSTTTLKVTTGLTSGTTYYFRVIATKTGYDDSVPSDSVSITPTTGDVDYDADNDGLIDVDSLAKLNAIRYDLNGDGVVDNASDATSYAAAFGSPEDNMGCGESAVTISSQNTGNPTCKGYELTANLDFDTNNSGGPNSGDTYWNGGQGWLPIGATAGSLTASAYTGEFDGGTYTISNLHVDRSGSTTVAHAGLFAELGSAAVVKNLRLEDVSVTVATNATATSAADVYAGGVAGKSAGSITGSYVEGTVKATQSDNTNTSPSVTEEDAFAGGLVGESTGPIVSSYARATVTAEQLSGTASKEAPGGRAGGTPGHGRVHRGQLLLRHGDRRQQVVHGREVLRGRACGLPGLGQRQGQLLPRPPRGQDRGLGDDGHADGWRAHRPAPVGGQHRGVLLHGHAHDIGREQPHHLRRRAGGPEQRHGDQQLLGHDGVGHHGDGAGAGKTTSELQTPTSYGITAGIYGQWNIDVGGTSAIDDPWDFGTASQYPAIDYGMTAASQRATLTLSATHANICESAKGYGTVQGVTYACGSDNRTSTTITATLGAAEVLPVTVTLDTDAAYTLSAASITIAAGSTTGTVTITAVNDTTDASDNAVTVGGDDGAELGEHHRRVPHHQG